MYSSLSKYSIEVSYDVIYGLQSDVQNFIPKNFYFPKRFAVKFQGVFLELFFIYDPISCMLSSILTLRSVY